MKERHLLKIIVVDFGHTLNQGDKKKSRKFGEVM
jgi:hypothetical protein